MAVVFQGHDKAEHGYCPKSGAMASGRLSREWQTISAMINLYCRLRHNCSDELCPECLDLLNYARVRLDRCRFGTEKPTCAKCPVHCYLPARREQIREVMRFAGPRMLWHHPLLSFYHWIDGAKSRWMGHSG